MAFLQQQIYPRNRKWPLRKPLGKNLLWKFKSHFQTFSRSQKHLIRLHTLHILHSNWKKRGGKANHRRLLFKRIRLMSRKQLILHSSTPSLPKKRIREISDWIFIWIEQIGKKERNSRETIKWYGVQRVRKLLGYQDYQIFTGAGWSLFKWDQSF